MHRTEKQTVRSCRKPPHPPDSHTSVLPPAPWPRWRAGAFFKAGFCSWKRIFFSSLTSLVAEGTPIQNLTARKSQQLVFVQVHGHRQVHGQVHGHGQVHCFTWFLSNCFFGVLLFRFFGLLMKNNWRMFCHGNLMWPQVTSRVTKSCFLTSFLLSLQSLWSSNFPFSYMIDDS